MGMGYIVYAMYGNVPMSEWRVKVKKEVSMEYEKLERKNRERYLDKVILAKRGYLRRRLLGQGSFSDVYCVEDAADGRLYVCKISWKAETLEWEAQVMERLRHPLFPEYADFWKEGRLGFLLREYVPGESLEEMLRRRCFSARQTICVGRMLAEGLQFLHGLPEPLLFRDIKPANVIIRQDGRAALVDLGCVCEMRRKSDSRAGSPGFAAPEQFGGNGRLTAACDVYGLGQTLKAMMGTKSHGLGRTCESAHGASGSPGKPWMGSEKRKRKKEKKSEKEFRNMLEACTKEEAACRIQSMESVLQIFLKFDEKL